MALLDLDKIIVKRTVIGVRCTAYGENLLERKKKDNAETSDKADHIRNHKVKKLRVRKLQKEVRFIITGKLSSSLSNN
jgi:hypothetical protein